MATILEKKDAEEKIVRATRVFDSIQTQAAAARALINGLAVDAINAAIDGTSTTTGDLDALKTKLQTIVDL